MSPDDNEIPTSPGRAAVLVVDDEPAVGKVLARILRDHDVTVVTKAEEALALLAASKHFDVILSDLMMPGMSGMAFYEELTQRYPDAARCVAFVTGGIFSPDVSAFLERIPNEHMAKPLNAESVRSLVRRLLSAT
jgi:CheY-like chemotaxis protein